MQFAFVYVALVFAAAVFLWNRFAPVRLEWRIALLFYLLVLLLLFKPLTQNYVGFPADLIFGLYPWLGVGQEFEWSNHEINDVTLQMVPWAHQIREAWKSGEPPLWNDNAGSGYPLLANGQSGAFSIFRWLAIPFDLGTSFSVEVALKILLALAGAYLFLRRRNLSPNAAVVGAISFGFCTFNIVWLYFPHVSTAVFLPLVFLGIEFLIERPRFLRLFFLAVVFALMLLNGHPETAAHIVFGSGLWLLWRMITREASMKSVGAITVAGLIALALSGPMLLPLAEALPFSQRMDLLRQELQHGESSFVPQLLTNVVQVGFYGTGFEETMWGPTIPEFVSTYAGIAGVIGWIAALMELRRRRWRDPLFFFVPATVLIMGIAYNWPVFSEAFHKIPLFSLAANGRLRLVLCWFLAILAAEAIRLLDDPEGRRSVLAGTSAALLILLSLFILHRIPPEARFLEVAVTTTIPRLLVIVAFALALLAARRRIPALLVFAPAILITAVSIDLLHWDLRWNPPVPASMVYPETPLITELVERQRSPQQGEVFPFRIAAATSTFFPNAAAVFGLEDIRSHDPMAYGRYLGALRVFTGYSSDEYFGMLRHFDDPFIDYLNVRYVITGAHEGLTHPRFQQIYDGVDGKLFRNMEALPRFYPARNVIVEYDDHKRFTRIRQNRDWANTVILKYIPSDLESLVRADLLDPRPLSSPLATVKIVESKSTRFRLLVDAPRWTMIVSSQPQWPGWKVYRNGKERLKITEINAAFIGFIVPPGRSEIEVAYQPRSYTIGWQLSLLVLGIMIVIATAGAFFSHRGRATAPQR